MASGGSWAGIWALASAAGNSAAMDTAGAIGVTRTAAAGSSRPWTALGSGAGGAAGVSLAAGARPGPGAGPRIKIVRPFFPSSTKKPGCAGVCAFAPAVAGGTGAIGAAAGAAGGGATANNHSGGTGLGGLGAETAAGFAGGAAGTGGRAAAGLAAGAAGVAAAELAAGAVAGFAGGAPAGFVPGAAPAGFLAGSVADDAFPWDPGGVGAAGLGKPAGIAKDGGAARPMMVLPTAGFAIDFPVVGQVRVSGRCCFSQWGQGFSTGGTAGSTTRARLYPGKGQKGQTEGSAFAAGARAWHSVADVGLTGSRGCSFWRCRGWRRSRPARARGGRA